MWEVIHSECWDLHCLGSRVQGSSFFVRCESWTPDLPEGARRGENKRLSDEGISTLFDQRCHCWLNRFLRTLMRLEPEGTLSGGTE